MVLFPGLEATILGAQGQSSEGALSVRPLVCPVFAGVWQQVSLAVGREDLFAEAPWCCQTTQPSLACVCSPVMPVSRSPRPTGRFNKACLIDIWSNEFSLLNCLEMILFLKVFFLIKKILFNVCLRGRDRM